MLYNLIEIRRGKQTLVMTDTLPKINRRKKQLTVSHKGGMGMRGKSRVEYRVERSDAEKFYKPPHDIVLEGTSRVPRVPDTH